MIGILNYGLGNVASIKNMLDYIGHDSKLISNPLDINNVDKLILPGVGSYDPAIKILKDNCWIDSLNENVLIKKKPILGICLGMQVMCNSSEEGSLKGLGWVDADVKRFSFPANENLKVPHMGWNDVIFKKNSRLKDIDADMRFYFVHSYYVKCNDFKDVCGVTTYGESFISFFEKENIFGAQFHPEKSHKYGMKLLKSFAEV